MVGRNRFWRSQNSDQRRHHSRTARRPRRDRCRRAQPRHRARRKPGADLAGDHAVPRRRADDELRLTRHRCRYGSEVDPVDVLPQVVRVDQRAARRHRQAAARPVSGLRGRDRHRDGTRASGRRLRSPKKPWPTTSRASLSPTTYLRATSSSPRPSSTRPSPTPPSHPPGRPLSFWMPTSSSVSAISGCSCGSTVRFDRTWSSTAT